MLLAATAGRCAADAREQLLAEYEQPAKALLEHYKAVRATYRTREPAGPGQTRVTTVTAVFDYENARYDGIDSFLDAAGNPVGDPVLTSEVRNRQYEFTVRGKGEGGYVLERTALHAGRHSPWPPQVFPFADPWRQRTYLDLFHDPDTMVRAVRREVYRGRPVVVAEVEYSLRDAPNRPLRRVTGCFCFDPAAAWACAGEWSVPTPTDRSRYESAFQYVMRDGWPVPVREELWEVKIGEPGPGRLIRSTDYDEYVAIPPPDEAGFRMTAFGMPEPVDVTWTKPGRRWIWLAAGVAALVLVGLVFHRLSRRGARPGSAPPSASP